MRLDGRVAIISGAARGLGEAFARALHAAGASVVIADLLDDDAGALATELGDRALATHLDVTSEESWAAAVEATCSAFGTVDVLVNNAGIAGANKPTHEITEEEWDRVQAINVKGVFFCVKHAIAHLRRAGGGSIINLSSIYGLVGAADVPPYHASKGAVRLMSKNDALIYATDRIRVNSIHPGFIWTPMVEHHLRDSGATDIDAARREVGLLHPLGHMGDVDDIAWGVVYLASDEAKFVTGAELVIDGGYTAR